MKKILMAALLVAVAFPAAAKDKGPSYNKSVKAVQDVITGFQDAWNKKDYKGMANYFAEDADLINPSGRIATGKAEIEKLFQDEQTGVLKTSQQKMTPLSIRFPDKESAVADVDGYMTGLTSPDGKPAPDWKHHVLLVLRWKDDAWKIFSARPYEFMKPMGQQGQQGQQMQQPMQPSMPQQQPVTNP